jgi:hypothetical protein
MPALKIERCEQFYTDTDARSAQTYSYGGSASSHQRVTDSNRPRPPLHWRGREARSAAASCSSVTVEHRSHLIEECHRPSAGSAKVRHACRCILDHRPRERFTGRCRARGANGASVARNGSSCAAAARGISTATMAATMSDRLDVSVTFDAERGYVASAPELRHL